MRRFGETLGSEDAEAIVREADRDGDGRINRREFAELMKGLLAHAWLEGGVVVILREIEIEIESEIERRKCPKRKIYIYIEGERWGPIKRENGKNCWRGELDLYK